MPIFDFKCKECDTVFERIAKWDAHEVQVCPHCMSEHTEIQFPTPAIVRCNTLFGRQKIPTDFKQGVLEPIKKHYTKKGYNSDAIKV